MNLIIIFFTILIVKIYILKNKINEFYYLCIIYTLFFESKQIRILKLLTLVCTLLIIKFSMKQFWDLNLLDICFADEKDAEEIEEKIETHNNGLSLIKKALIITTAIIVIIIAIKFGVDHYNEFNNLKQNSDINAARLDKIEVSMDKLETSVNNVKTSINNLENDTFRRTIQPRINGFETEMYQFRSTNSTFQKRLEDFEYSVRKLTNITSQITSKLTKVEQQVNSQND